MTIVSNIGRPLLSPGHNPRGNAQVTYTLTNKDGLRIERLSADGSGPAYLGDVVVRFDANGEHSVELQPNDGLQDSHYIVTLRDGRSRRRWLITVPDSADPVDFWALVAAGQPLASR